MNEIPEKLDPESQRLIDEHLDAVEAALARGGMARGGRRRIVEDLELQIREMLGERSGANPAAGDVRALLAELDPPEAYASAAEDQPRPTPLMAQEPAPAPAHFSRTALIGALWAPLFFLVAASTTQPFLMSLVSMLAICAPFGTTILGCVAISQIRHSQGRVYGLGLATFDCLFYPLLALDGAVYLLWWLLWLRVGHHFRFANENDAWGFFWQMVSHPQASLEVLTLTVLVSILVDLRIVRRVWRAANRPLGQ